MLLRIKVFNLAGEQLHQIEGDKVEVEVGCISILKNGWYIANYNLPDTNCYTVEVVTDNE